MKKVLISLLSISLTLALLFSLCACSDGKFFSPSVLTAQGIPDLPRFESERVEKVTGGRIFKYGATEEQYNQYASDVYDYLKTRNFQYFGSRGEGSKENGSAVTDYELTRCSQQSDFICTEYTLFGKESGKYYAFVWARELKENNFLAGPRYFEIRYSPEDETMELRLNPVMQSFYVKEQ